MMLKNPLFEATAPWKLRFRAPQVFTTRMATANPTYGIAVSNVASDVFQVYGWDVPGGTLTQVTHRPAGLFAVVLAPDGRSLYYLDDRQGDETGHIVRIPYAGGKPLDLTPHLPSYVVSQESVLYGLTVSGSSQRLGAVVAHSNAFYLYCLDVGSHDAVQEPRLLYCSPHLAISPVLSYDGDVAVIATTERTGTLQYTLLAFEVSSGERLGELEDGAGASLEPIVCSPRPADPRVLATSDRSGRTRPLLWNPRTGERSDLPLDGLEGDILPLDWSADGERILLCEFVQAVQHLFVYDLESRQLHTLAHPGGTYGSRGTYFEPGGAIVAQWQDASHPPCVIELDGETGQQRRVLLSAGAVPAGQPWRSFTFPSTDGELVQGWLCVPEGEGPFPTILETHGGPSSVTVEAFDPACQAWVDHGFAFASINYRGSTTFGKQFLEQIWGNPGELEVEDLVGARKWLVEQGIARPDRILLTGWSYGGYLTLQALGKYPGLWAGGMGGIAVADRTLQYEYSSDKHRGYIAGLLGGTPQEKPEQYWKSSPITYAEQVDAPILLIQGRNDTRCPARQVEAYEEKMRTLGKPIEILWFDAGHGSLSMEQEIAFQERMLRFAYQVLGTL
ncbi:MAG: prolyl oligopeptidase family serine peptidase [Chloroflexota bacterium]|nr:prolyl oligopeptidase family serine peptidase [Chloroflexota bacterium]